MNKLLMTRIVIASAAFFVIVSLLTYIGENLKAFWTYYYPGVFIQVLISTVLWGIVMFFLYRRKFRE